MIIHIIEIYVPGVGMFPVANINNMYFQGIKKRDMPVGLYDSEVHARIMEQLINNQHSRAAEAVNDTIAHQRNLNNIL